MAKKKNKKNRVDPDGPIESRPTEDFGDMGGPSEQFVTEAAPFTDEGTGELDELDDVLVLLPDEDEPVNQDSVAFFATESVGDSIGFDEAIPITDAVDGQMPVTEEGFGTFGTMGGDSDAVTDTMMPSSTALPTMSGTSMVPGSESPTGVEDVGLLGQHPSHGLLPVDGYAEVEEEVLGLPDIEDVEDITSLVEEAVAYEMPPPQNDFEDEFLESDEDGAISAGSTGGVAIFVKLAAAAAILVTGVMFGPGIYEQYFSGSTTTVASTGGETIPETGVGSTNNGSDSGSTGTSTKDPLVATGGTGETGTTAVGTGTEPNSTGTTGTTTVTASANAARVEFGAWMSGVLANNFEATASDGR